MPLMLNLNKEEIDKLGFDPQIAQKISFQIVTEVVEIRQIEAQGSEAKESISLKITDMGIITHEEENESDAQREERPHFVGGVF